MPGVTPSPWGAAAHSGIGAIWPWLESGEPMLDDEALAMLRSDDGPSTSPSSGYMPGDALSLLLLLLLLLSLLLLLLSLLLLLYMYGASAYTAPLSKPIVVG